MEHQDKDYYYLIFAPKEFTIKAIVEMRQEVEKALETEHKTIVFEMQKCNHIDSSAIALIANADHRCKEHGGKLGLYMPTDAVSELLKTSGLDTMVEVYHTDDALEIDLQPERRQIAIDKALEEIHKREKR